MGLRSGAAAPSDRSCGQMLRCTSSGRVTKAPKAADAGDQWQRTRTRTAGRRPEPAKPGPNPRGEETVLQIQRVHTLQKARDDFGGKFVTPYESEATEPIGGIKAEWPTHDARNGEVLVLKEHGSVRVRRPTLLRDTGASYQPGIRSCVKGHREDGVELPWATVPQGHQGLGTSCAHARRHQLRLAT